MNAKYLPFLNGKCSALKMVRNESNRGMAKREGLSVPFAFI